MDKREFEKIIESGMNEKQYQVLFQEFQKFGGKIMILKVFRQRIKIGYLDRIGNQYDIGFFNYIGSFKFIEKCF